jgi:hypothetical protein
VKDKRIGESLWIHWDGEGYIEQKLYTDNIYYTKEHVDFENELVRRGLASTLQRDGIVDSLSDGFNSIADSHVEIGWAGIIEGENNYTFCDANGETEYGEYVEEVFEFTWVEL